MNTQGLGAMKTQVLDAVNTQGLDVVNTKVLDAMNTPGIVDSPLLLPPYSLLLFSSLIFPPFRGLILTISLWVKQECMILVLRMLTESPYNE